MQPLGKSLQNFRRGDLKPAGDNGLHLNGTSTPIGPMTGFVEPYGLAYDTLRDRLLVSSGFNTTASQIAEVSRTTGALSNVVTFGNWNGIEGLAYSASRDRLYALPRLGGLVLSLDPVTFAATPLPITLPAANWRGLEYDQTTDSLFLSVAHVSGGQLWRLTLSGTPTLTFMAPQPPGLHGLAIIPAPGALALLSVAGVLAARRSRPR